MMTPSPMVSGFRKNRVKVALWSRILWTAVRAYPNPARALSALRRLIAFRGVVREHHATTKYVAAGGRHFWDLYAPGFPSKAFDAYVEHELQRIEPFRSGPRAMQTVIVAMTRRCPLRCEHCCEWDDLNKAEALSLADLQTIVEQFQARGVGQIMLSGGEPLQRFDDVVSIVRAARLESDFWLLTSGYKLTAERAHLLRQAGLTGVVISLDHWDPQQHDAFRGLSGAQEWVEKAAGHARAAGLVLALAMVPTREFITESNLERYAHHARALGAGFIHILEPKSVGHYASKDVLLDERQLELLASFYYRMNFDPGCLQMPAVAYAGLAKRQMGCVGGGDRYLYVDTAGYLLPCPFCRTGSPISAKDDFDAALAAVREQGCPAGGACNVAISTSRHEGASDHGRSRTTLPVL
jgi:MoaA/NifB/PqqE/SkfB family radical SAM enzyme